MKSIFIVTIIVLLITNLAQAQGPPFSCVPEEDCVIDGTSNGDFVPDPTDCESYYVCITSAGGTLTPFPAKCPNGQYFSQNVTNYGCINETIPGTCVNDCQVPGNVKCSSVCPDPFEDIITYVADKTNCSLFSVCLQPGPVHSSCSDNTPYFDATLSTCVSDPAVCCDFCTPYCLLDKGQIQDPCDCTSFYICQTADMVPTLKLTCGEGTYYDETSVGCIPGTCTNLCSGSKCGTSVGSETTTTTSPIPDNCPDTSSYTCLASNGNFPRCPYCDRSFFHCSNNIPSISYCNGNELFNTNLAYPYCLDPATFTCPYNG